MKKFLLLAAFAVTATLASAQASSVQKVTMPTLKERMAKITAQQPMERLLPGMQKTRRTAKTGLYYTRPAGTLYTCWDEAGSGYGLELLVANPFVDTKFIPQAPTGSDIAWHLNILNSKGVATTSVDITDAADENGVLSFPAEMKIWYPIPTLVTLTDSFALGHLPYVDNSGNYYWSQDKSHYTRLITDSIAPHSFVDDHAGDTWYWGVLDAKHPVSYNGSPRKFLYGTGTYQMGEGEDSLAVSFGVQQYFEKPQTPLYVENIFMRAASTVEAPLASDAKLVMTITNAHYDENEKYYVAGDKVIATLVCTSEDVANMTSEALGDGTIYDYSLTFRQIVETGFGPAEEPFAIDEPFMVTITGFADDGVDILVPGIENPLEDPIETGYLMYTMGDKSYTGPFYGGTVSIPVVFNSCFDHAEPWKTASTGQEELQNFNVLLVSNDGQTITNKGYEDLAFAYVSTAFCWFDTENNENYYLLDEDMNDAPEWIKGFEAMSDFDDDGYYTGESYVTVTECDPLPQDVKGRYAVLYVYGRGVVSETPIIIAQGDVDVETLSIASANVQKMSADKFFNLKGQQTTKATKGIVIRDGKKFFAK